MIKSRVMICSAIGKRRGASRVLVEGEVLRERDNLGDLG